MAQPIGALERSLAALTIGMQQDMRSRERASDDVRGGEVEQQVHVPLSGFADGWAFADVNVTWEFPFVYAPLQRAVPFEFPHFTCGVEIVSAEDLVVFHAHVIAWTITPEGWITGATVRFACTAPLSAPVPYSAVAHLSFQGYAGATEYGADA